MKLIGILLAFLLTGCSAAEVAIFEGATEEALIIEKDLMAPPQVQVIPKPVDPTQHALYKRVP